MIRLHEGLEQGDLKRLVHTEMHVDDFKSKLGRDEDVVVISLKVTGKEPATDIVNFVEKGYEWVIDADVSSGEMDDGDYIVFIEAERDQDIAKNIMTLMSHVMNLTDQDTEDWCVQYYKDSKFHELTEETLESLIPKSPEEYQAKFGTEELDNMRAAAGVEVTTKAPKNDFTESLRIAAGIK
jgi:hypothetical protein